MLPHPLHEGERRELEVKKAKEEQAPLGADARRRHVERAGLLWNACVRMDTIALETQSKCMLQCIHTSPDPYSTLIFPAPPEQRPPPTYLLPTSPPIQIRTY